MKLKVNFFIKNIFKKYFERIQTVLFNLNAIVFQIFYEIELIEIIIDFFFKV